MKRNKKKKIDKNNMSPHSKGRHNYVYNKPLGITLYTNVLKNCFKKNHFTQSDINGIHVDFESSITGQ